MYISLIYVLFSAEFMLIMTALAVSMGIYIYKKKLYREDSVITSEPIDQSSENIVDIGNSYSDYIDQEIERNKEKIAQLEAANSTEADTETDEDSSETSANNRENIELLNARGMFLDIEKEASSHADNEGAFWKSLYKGFKNAIKKFRGKDKDATTETIVNTKKEQTEKVFYIETQGKKVDTEVNKLKDIIYEQENVLNSMRKSLNTAKQNLPDDSTSSNEELEQLMAQLEAFEQQVNDSRMCMDVLELENTRLQDELSQLEHEFEEIASSKSTSEGKSEPVINLDEMKEIIQKQENQIKELTNTINSLKIDKNQAERLKTTIGDFARTSQEMMGCINILEEENERLQHELDEIHQNTDTGVDTDADNELTELLESHETKISQLEEDIIKKDVAYAKLQDEFSSMEKEYLAMYEALHGENS